MNDRRQKKGINVWVKVSFSVGFDLEKCMQKNVPLGCKIAFPLVIIAKECFLWL